MFLSSKGIIVIISMYCLSVCLLAGQWAIGDVFGITLTDFYGNPLSPNVLTLVNTGGLNTYQANATSSIPIVNVITTNVNALGQIIQLASGTYIFNVLFYLGVPGILVAGMTIVYIIFLMIFIGSMVYRVTI